MIHRWLSPRSLLLHLLLLVVAPGCLVAGWWQVHRALSGNLLSYGYSVEWPAFAIIAGVAWWQLIHDGWARTPAPGAEPSDGDEAAGQAGGAAPAGGVAAGATGSSVAGVGAGASPRPTRPRRPWEPEPGTPEWEAFQADLAEDLATRIPKTWGGRRSEPASAEKH